MATLYSVLPKLRVGIDPCVLAFTGRSGRVPAVAFDNIVPLDSRPAATAPPVFKKSRRPEPEEIICFFMAIYLGWNLELGNIITSHLNLTSRSTLLPARNQNRRDCFRVCNAM